MNKLIAGEQKWIDDIWGKIQSKLEIVSERSKNKIPYSCIDGIHDDCSLWGNNRRPDQWTNGFWAGMLWMMYASTKEDKYKSIAEYTENVLDTVLTQYDFLSHDMGFMWHLSSGANYRLTKNEKSRGRNLIAASLLASRYNTDGKFIRAWNDPGRDGWAIIDCMMNLPLLYWASEEIGDPRFRQIAIHHADSTLKNHIRDDGSVYHMVEYDLDNGNIIGYPSTQGYNAEKSSWTRGQGWALYGFVLSYIHTGDKRYLDTAKRVAHYFISAVCNENYIPKCDFRAPDEPCYVDTTAGAIASCGLIEIAKCVDEYEKKMYFDAAIKILKALEKNYCNFDFDKDFILDGGTERYGRGVHIPIIYGDYFFMEAIYKLKGYKLLLW